MSKILFSILLYFIVLTPGFADHHIRPGLWEIATRSDLLSLVPHIPPEHMQQLHNLAKRHGIKLPKIENNAVASKICITDEMARQEIPTYLYEYRSGCTVQNAIRTGNRYRLELTCANKHFQGTGSAQGTFATPESFTGTTEFESTVGAAPLFATAEIQGHWVNEHCTAANPLP